MCVCVCVCVLMANPDSRSVSVLHLSYRRPLGRRTTDRRNSSVDRRKKVILAKLQGRLFLLIFVSLSLSLSFFLFFWQ